MEDKNKKNAELQIDKEQAAGVAFEKELGLEIRSEGDRHLEKQSETAANCQSRERVVAVTVTYNRTRTLRRCIEALLAQTRPLDEILIVDNHSNDTERAVLDEILSWDARLHLIELSDNMGGAGGFEAGMRQARDQYHPDWYWLMDDDAYPRKDCLEKLLETGHTMPDVGGVCPLIYGIDLKHYQLFHHKNMTGLMMKNTPVARDADQLKAVTEEEANAFVGPLFPGNVVEELGIADGSLFIYGDDSEYTYRVSRKHKLYLVKDAVIDHQDAPVTDANMSPAGFWKEYYCFRNQYFMIREFHHNAAKRYLAYGIYTIRLFAIIAKSVIKRYHPLRIRMILKAIADGMNNRRGKTVDPQKYFAYLKEKNIM
jgi:GT2 family glycosyltransferase